MTDEVGIPPAFRNFERRVGLELTGFCSLVGKNVIINLRSGQRFGSAGKVLYEGDLGGQQLEVVGWKENEEKGRVGLGIQIQQSQPCAVTFGMDGAKGKGKGQGGR